MNLKLNIFKDKLFTPNEKKEAKSDEKLTATVPVEQINDSNLSSPEIGERNIPQFMSIAKLDFENYDVRSGVIKDPTAKGGIRYQILEPVLTERDEKALEIIKKLLMTELSISMGEIRSKKEAEKRLGAKIEKMIKSYRLKIPPKNISKIKY